MRNPNGYGSVVKLGGNRRKPFAVRITVGYSDEGKQIYKYISYHANRNDALIALAQYNKDPFDLNANNITFNDIYKAWSQKAFQQMSKSTIESYNTAYKRCEQLYDKQFKNLRKVHLESLIDSIDKPHIAKQVKFLFTKLYRHAMENDICHKDYSEFIKVKQPETQKEYKVFSCEDIQKLWDHVDTHSYADTALILLYTGMRIGELFALDKSNVHLEDRYIIGGIKTKAGIDRIIPIHKDIIPLLKKRLDYPHSNVLIPNTKNMRTVYSTFKRRQWDLYMKQIGLDYNPHDARHTFISKMDQLNINPITLRRIVGHSNKNVTDIYTHKSIDDLIEAIDKLVYC